MPIDRREIAALIVVLLGGLIIRTIKLDQPIVENDVGRQIPTAMVARNLDRGSGFFHPELDSGPFPNYFLVEPPVYQTLVIGLKRATSLRLEPAARLVSALAITLGALGLWSLTRRREGSRIALLTAIAVSLLPVALRYGRAAQPDPLALGLSLAGVAAWDCSARSESKSIRRWVWLSLAISLLAAGMSVKVIYGFVLAPLWFAIIPPRRRVSEIPLTLLALIPAISWYVHADTLLGQGSDASRQNAEIWRDVLTSRAWELTWREPFDLAFRLLRAYSPIGLVLGLLGWIAAGRVDRLWYSWGIAVVGLSIVLAPKLHHGYYWLWISPIVSVGIARSLFLLINQGRNGSIVAILVGTLATSASVAQSRSTWSTPDEWRDLSIAGGLVAEATPGDEWLVAPEALLYFGDRKGCRLEWNPDSQRRAASEWDGVIQARDPLELIEFYRARGATHFAELPNRIDSLPGLREALVNRFEVVIDSPHLLLLALAPSKESRRDGRR
jgi:Dolichyl-phosphate-mannose-protein mannosyltransferase